MLFSILTLPRFLFLLTKVKVHKIVTSDMIVIIIINITKISPVIGPERGNIHIYSEHLL